MALYHLFEAKVYKNRYACVRLSHQQDSLSLYNHNPGSRVQDKRLHKVVLGHVDKSRLHAGSKDDLFGLFGT